MNLYELTKEWKDLQDLLLDDSLEPSDLEKAYLEISAERNQKLENIRKLLKHLQADVDIIQAEKDRLNVFQKKYESKIESLLSWVEKCLLPGEKFDCPIGGFSWRESEYLDSAENAKIPKAFQRVKIEPDKNAIKAALKTGKKIAGWFLAKRQNLQVK